MKKILIGCIAIFAIFVFAGCSKIATKTDETKTTSQQDEKVAANGGIINSLKDAMGLGQKMDCTYKTKLDDEVYESRAIVQGEKYKTIENYDGKKMISIFDGKVAYTWTEGENKGSKFEINCMEELFKDDTDTDSSSGDKEEFKDIIKDEEDFEDTTDTKCVPTNESLEIPKDIIFEDACVELKEQLESLKKQETVNPQFNLAQ